MSKVEDRLAALEAENARLSAEIASLKPAPAEPAPPAPEPRSMRIHQSASGFAFVMPAADEMRALHKIVLAAYPALEQKVGRYDQPDAPFESFCAAFAAIGRTGRTAAPIDNISVSYYLDFLNQLLGGGADVTCAAFWAAVVAHGDVAFRPFEPDGWAAGLEHRVNAGRPATGDTWRAVLARGKAPRPTHAIRNVPQWDVATRHIPSW